MLYPIKPWIKSFFFNCWSYVRVRVKGCVHKQKHDVIGQRVQLWWRCLRRSVFPRHWPALTSTPGEITAGCFWPSRREAPPRTSGKTLPPSALDSKALKDRASISIGESFKPSSGQFCVWIWSAIASTFTKITFSHVSVNPKAHGSVA